GKFDVSEQGRVRGLFQIKQVTRLEHIPIVGTPLRLSAFFFLCGSASSVYDSLTIETNTMPGPSSDAHDLL
ncbi:MAG: hypothetical protein AAB380_00665, partial [Verrucomicrobiota bacterium]